MTTPAPVTGSSIPTTVTDDAGNVLKGTVVTVTGPGSYSGTATTDATTGVLQLTGLTVGDYTVSLNGRSVVIPVLPARAALGTAVQQAGAAVRTVNGTAPDGSGNIVVAGGGGTVPAATSTALGTVQLAGDLGGTAAAPTVPGLATKVTSAQAAAAAPVQSVAGRTGAVVLASTDVSGLATVATSGSYADLTNKPSVGGLTPTATKTTAYTANAGEHVAVNATGGAVVVTLPTNPAVGTLVGAFKVDADASSNQVTLLPAGGGTVDADTTGAKFSTPHASAVVEHLGANAWKVYISYPVTGPAGPTGATGPAGATGPQGATGATGAAGTNGTSSYLIPTSKTAAYTAAANDLVEADATSAGFTVTLPTPTAGTRVGVKKVDSTTNAVTVATTSGLIDGQATRPLSAQYASQIYIGDGTNWQRLDTPQVTAIAATGTPSATTYLRGDGSWATVTSGGSIGGFWGDGSDGAATFDGTSTVVGFTRSGTTYTATRDVFFSTAAINSGVRVTMASFVFHCNGTLTVNSGGQLDYNGNNAAANVGGASQPAQVVSNSVAGGNGANPGAVGGNQTSLSVGGAGGAGGTSGTAVAGGAGGTVNSPILGTVSDSTRRIFSAVSGRTFGNTFGSIYTGGAGGGGGGNDGTNPAGGGGAGGGVLIVNGKTVVNNGAIQARGGNGANASATGNSAGGGGGGGGWCQVNTQAYSGSGTVDANGGAAGTSTGTATAATAGTAGLSRVTVWV